MDEQNEKKIKNANISLRELVTFNIGEQVHYAISLIAFKLNQKWPAYLQTMNQNAIMIKFYMNLLDLLKIYHKNSIPEAINPGGQSGKHGDLYKYTRIFDKRYLLF